MSLGVLLGVAIGGALGATLRYLTAQMVGTSSGFPLGTFLVNIIGCFAIGVCYVLITEKSILPELWRPILMAGFLGGLTTFSSYSLEAIQLFEDGRWQLALGYIVFSVIFCILAAFSGVLLARAV